MSSESGKPFGLSFAAFFLLLFGGGLFYEESRSVLTDVSGVTSKNLMGLATNPYFLLGSLLLVLGIICAILAVVTASRRRAAKKPPVVSQQNRAPNS